jgi:hypothetical protein
MAGRKGSTTEVKEEGSGERCGECKKLVSRNDKGITCELCETLFHCKCQDISEEAFKVLSHDRFHFYCGRCDKVVGKILKSVSELNLRQDKLEEKVVKVEEGLNQIRGERLDQQKKMEVEIKKVRDELQEIKNCNTGGSGEHTDEAELKKLQKEMGGMKVEIESVVNNSVRNVKVDVEEALEIERRKCNLVIHGMPETDAEQDVGCVVEMMDEVLHMDFTRNVDKVERIGRLVEGRVRPLRVMLKRLEGKKEILARAKLLKEVEKFKKMFISPDLTRKQQEKDKELRRQLKLIRETGVMGARIKNGKVIKNETGGREIVLFQFPTQ